MKLGNITILWANFPKARKRLFDLVSSVSSPLIILSGDRYLSEVSKMGVSGYSYQLYEFTSSSLTSPSGVTNEENQYLIKMKTYEPNYALLTVLRMADKPILNLSYYGRKNKVLESYRIEFQ